ncbi:MAG TPA: hypothetical protein VI916_05440 [Acidimicrobiia bacterium]|nr:hypothetical protein [Acidimicrobiia bacterium]
MNEPALSACSEEAVALLTSIGVDWALIGAFAALRHRAQGRETTDVDFLVAHHEGIPEGLQDRAFSVTVQRDEGEPWFIRGRKYGVAVEFLVVQTAYQEEALRRAIDHVITAEDVIVHKLIAWRPKDRDDIESILANPDVTLDETYIEHWAGEWEVLDRWREARGR